jgi:hypothetical protein
MDSCRSDRALRARSPKIASPSHTRRYSRARVAVAVIRGPTSRALPSTGRVTRAAIHEHTPPRVAVGRHPPPAPLFAGSPHPRHTARSRALSTALCAAPPRAVHRVDRPLYRCIAEPAQTARSAQNALSASYRNDDRCPRSCAATSPRQLGPRDPPRPTQDRGGRLLRRCARPRALQAEKRRCFT